MLGLSDLRDSRLITKAVILLSKRPSLVPFFYNESGCSDGQITLWLL